MTGFDSYKALREAHQELVNESLANGNNQRQVHLTESIAAGSKNFIETIHKKLGSFAQERKILVTEEGFQLREEMATYIANYDRENGNIGVKNTHFWKIST